MRPALANTEFRPGDVLLADMIGSQSDLRAFCDAEKLEPLEYTEAHLTDLSQAMGLAEVMLPLRSELIPCAKRDFGPATV